LTGKFWKTIIQKSNDGEVIIFVYMFFLYIQIIENLKGVDKLTNYMTHVTNKVKREPLGWLDAPGAPPAPSRPGYLKNYKLSNLVTKLLT
jgi:hypothetical protein